MVAEGTLNFWAKPEQADWTTNAQRYNFGPFVRDGISLMAKKEPDRSFIVEVAGPFSQPFYFRAATPSPGPEGVQVALSWKDRNITLFLNGTSVETKVAV